MTRLTPRFLLTFLGVFSAVATSHAAVQAKPARTTSLSEVSTSTWEISIASGYGYLENPIAGKRDSETYLLPSFSYYGKRFFVSDLTVGYSLLENKNVYLDLVARPNEDGLYFQLDKNKAADGLVTNWFTHFQAPNPEDVERKVSVVGGPSVTLVSDWVDVSFSWFHDLSNVHHGSEAHLSFDKQYPLFAGAIGFGIGAIQKDADLVSYYYQFSEQEADIFYNRYLAAHPADDATDTYARVHFSYPLGKHLSLRLAARYNDFDEAGRNARFIDKPHTLSWFAGLQYAFGSGH
ncbi:MipA/OmpV family protein [Microbulbifer sp. CAU 1566]|uniref:MipA/OmpV family protein n=1 Tax=Microbulbifer sp. CAU 1566 TaxID=2933269 RepID=UPI002002FC08|nr:MipA/OmpV family protein [Microbulbifer sp. CAU 1566]MCK7597869.1 MipA/OmpV family protein [Microbulbifer sp. CAU 1566]